MRARPHADAAALLAAAFAGGPAETAIQPDVDRQRRTLPTMFHGVLARCEAVGGIEQVRGDDGRLTAVCAWLPSRELVVSPIDVLRAGFWRLPLPGAFGPAATWRLLRHEHVTDAALVRHAADDVAYLWVLGVDPAAHGTGLGRRAVDRGTAAMRAAGFRRVLLKTETPRNVGLYRHLGFELVEEVPDPRAVPAWLFLRDL